MNGMKNLLYAALVIFGLAVAAAVLIIFMPHNDAGKLEEYENAGVNTQTTVDVPEYTVDDEFRKEIVSDF